MTYIIRETHHYYGPSSKTETVQDRLGYDDATFASREEAKAHIAALTEGDYRLDHNECCRPTYRIRKH